MYVRLAFFPLEVGLLVDNVHAVDLGVSSTYDFKMIVVNLR